MNARITTKTLNGEIIEADVSTYVDRFNKSMKKTAESIIEMGRTISEACQVLGPRPLAQFCEEIGMETSNPMFKKLKKIGERHARLEANLTQLPNTWTTIYKIAQLNDDNFAKVVESNVLTPYVTAKQINECLGTTKIRSCDAAKVANSITISVSSDMENTAMLIARLQDLHRDFNFELNLDEGLEQQISVYNQAKEV